MGEACTSCRFVGINLSFLPLATLIRCPPAGQEEEEGQLSSLLDRQARDTVCTQTLQRCDAKRPCATCVNSGGGSGCSYQEPRTPYRHHVIVPVPKTAQSFPFSDEGTPGPSSIGSVSRWLIDRSKEVAEPSANPGSQIDHPARSDPEPVGQDQLPATSKVSSTSHALSSASGGIRHDVQLGPRRPPNLPPSMSSKLSILPSLRLPIIPRPLHTPLSFFPPENFQVAGEASGNFEMLLYASLVVPLGH